MNRQDKWADGKLISRGIEWTQIHGRPGYTANPVKGCDHGCRWQMPDGTWAQCYAKEVAEGIAKSAYPGGFEVINYDAGELAKITHHKKPSGIFIDSMSDLFGRNVAFPAVSQVLDCIGNNPQHIFFTLTKNPPRLALFEPQLKLLDNLLCGISAPPTEMFGKVLTFEQQAQWLRVGLDRLAKCGAKWPWISIEPLSFDIAPILHEFRGMLKWAVVGAASSGRQYFQPAQMHLMRVMSFFDHERVPVFFKGNLSKELAGTVGGWREQFPAIGQAHGSHHSSTLV